MFWDTKESLIWLHDVSLWASAQLASYGVSHRDSVRLPWSSPSGCGLVVLLWSRLRWWLGWWFRGTNHYTWKVWKEWSVPWWASPFPINLKQSIPTDIFFLSLGWSSELDSAPRYRGAENCINFGLPNSWGFPIALNNGICAVRDASSRNLTLTFISLSFNGDTTTTPFLLSGWSLSPTIDFGLFQLSTLVFKSWLLYWFYAIQFVRYFPTFSNDFLKRLDPFILFSQFIIFSNHKLLFLSPTHLPPLSRH